MSRPPAAPVKMATWVVTGPIGAGKSAVSTILAGLGAAIVDCDRLGHDLLERPAIQAAIGMRLGMQYVVDGVVSRDRLGALVFADPVALATLNNITHGPLSRLAAQKLAELALRAEHKLAVLEAAVYFLLPSPPPVDLVVAVVAAPPLRVQRLLERSQGRLNRAEASARVAAQTNLAELWQQADEIIVNDGTLAELEVQIMRLKNRLRPGSENMP